MVKIGSLPVTKKAAKELYERLYPQAQTIKLIADFQLNILRDPNCAVREIRFSIFKDSNPEPKHYYPCPCLSGKKYKKCHRNKPSGLENLIYGSSN